MGPATSEPNCVTRAQRLGARAATAGAVFLLARASFAADPLSAFKLEWEAPGTCPPRSALERELRRDIAGSDVQAVPLRARVTMAQLSEHRFTASIVAEGAVGRSTRQFEADTCSELVSAVSLIIATMIDPEGIARRAQAQRPKPMDSGSIADSTRVGDSTEVSSSTPMAPPDRAHIDFPASNQPKEEAVSRVAPRQTSAIPQQTTSTAQQTTSNLQQLASNPNPPQDHRATAARNFGYAAGLAELDVGSFPSKTAAFGGSLGWESGGLRVEGNLGWWMPQAESWNLAPNPRAGARFAMLAGGIRGCFRAYRRGWFDLYPCAGLEYRVLTARANDFVAEPGEAKRRGAAPLAGSLLTAALTHWLALRATVGMAFPLDRPVFVIDGLGGLHQPSWVSLRAGIGAEVHFP